ncbi:Na/Pi cotransporter family protein [Calderihabitans maritimus]|uniref:Na/Pi cotransporter II-like protein n=1 Tax=Calderihabitans maritimus TaxID=1246530 RepID=A0A1Z5HS78_9FIRM|nr:Na/Pi cotransporter family protein [Calderihabitans maritimus]GAW92372.1 Na/Pi cotransporter II-like protein [Calderihabitans maritimus]
MEIATILIGLFGGLGIFIYGMNITSEGLQKVAAHRMKTVLGTLTNNPVSGVLVGIIITVLLQSSSATTVLLVGFVSASLMSLGQALGVMLGSAVGTTLTVQLIAFKVTDYALLLVGIGVAMGLFSRKQKYKHIGQAILGFGFVFYGMKVMASAVYPLRSYQAFVDILVGLSDNLFLALVVSAIFTAIIQGSAASIALIMTLTVQGVLALETAISMTLGANIGTTATGLLASIKSSREAKRVAVAHLIFKLAGALVFMPFLGPFKALVAMTSADAGRQIANSHTIFNVINMLLFLPFTARLADFMTWLIPDAEQEEKVAKFLDERVLDVPDLALEQTKNEILRMAKLVREEMLGEVMELLRTGDEKLIERINEMEKTIDFLYSAVTRYLVSLAQQNLIKDQSEQEVKLLYICNDLEHLGDVIIAISRIARKMKQRGLQIPEEGWGELSAMYWQVVNNFSLAIEAFANDDKKTASDVIKARPETLRMEKSLRYSHFQRLTSDKRDFLEISAVYEDLINYMLQINHHSVSIAQAVMGIV